MGEFRFEIPEHWKLDSFHGHSIHVLGLDGIPWPCRIATGPPVEDRPRKVLSISRNNDSSGKVYIHFPSDKYGELLICTATLPVRETIYELLVELARGTVNRLRNQLSIWKEGGLEISDSVNSFVQQATRTLGKAILSPDWKTREALAEQSIELSLDAIFGLSKDFGQQIAKFRRNHQDLNNFWLAAVSNSASDDELVANNKRFELLQINVAHRSGDTNQVLQDEKRKFGKRLIVGPWLDASIGGMSDRLVELDDFPVRRNQVVSDIRADLKRLPAEASLLHVVGGLNGIGHRHLSHPQQTQLTVDLLRQVEDAQLSIPTMISFDFPWAERLAGAVGGIHPLQIADSLLRQGLEVSVLGLEINLDYWPNGSTVRDPLQWIDLVDIWAQLGLPLILYLRTPLNDFRSHSSASNKAGHVNSSPSQVSCKHRIEFLKTTIPMMIARPAVYGLVWSQSRDQNDARYPQAGIFEANEFKPSLSPLIEEIRKHIDG